MKIVSLLVITFFAFCPLSYSQSSVDADAVRNADVFLAALKIAEISEGKQGMRTASWSANSYTLRNTPVVLDHTTLYQGMFDTDVSGVQGYKRLLELRVQSKARTVLTARYILISFKDRKSGIWKVFDVRDLGSDSIESTLDFFKRGLGDTRYSAKQLNYSNYAYWLTFAGRLQDATEARLTAATINKAQPHRNFSQSDHDEDIRILQAIIGE